VHLVVICPAVREPTHERWVAVEIEDDRLVFGKDGIEVGIR